MDSHTRLSPGTETLLFFGLASAASLVLQLSFPQVVGSDGFFHLRMAHEPLGGMDWMPQSIFSEGWVDHQLLFHLLMAPFAAAIEGIAAAKVAAAIFAALATTACFRFLRSEEVPGAAVFALLPGAVSWVFLMRMEMPRTQSLSLLFIVLTLIALQARRTLLVFVLAWAYMASYHVALILLPIAIVHGLVHRPPGRRIDFKPVLVTAGGLLAGLSVHPHSPGTYKFLWNHVVKKVANRGSLPVGGEWRDGVLGLLTAGGQDGEVVRVLSFSLGPFLLLLAALYCFRRAGLQRSREALLLLCLAGGSCLGLLFASKAVEYAAPLASLALALTLRDLSPEWLQQQRARLRLGCIVGAALILQGSWLRSAVEATEPPPDRFAPAAEYLRATAEPSEVIYHFSWGDFPELVWHAPEFRYVVGLDPHFLQLESNELWQRYDALARCAYTNPSKPIRELFGARWALVSLPWRGAEGCMAQDPNMDLVFRSPGALVYQVKGGATEKQ